MEHAYHLEALRKQRVIERKHEAQQSMDYRGQCASQKVAVPAANQAKNTQLEMEAKKTADYYVNRGNLADMRVTHDTNFWYRVLGGSRHGPHHVDQIYGVMYPGGTV